MLYIERGRSVKTETPFSLHHWYHQIIYEEDVLYEETGNHCPAGEAGRLERHSGGLPGQRYHDKQYHGLWEPEGYTQMYRGTTYTVNLLPKMKVETVVPEDIAETIIDKVVKEITTGNYGDGKNLIYDVQDAVLYPHRRERRRSSVTIQVHTHSPIINGDDCTCSHLRFLVETYGMCKGRE